VLKYYAAAVFLNYLAAFRSGRQLYCTISVSFGQPSNGYIGASVFCAACALQNRLLLVEKLRVAVMRGFINFPSSVLTLRSVHLPPRGKAKLNNRVLLYPKSTLTFGRIN